MAHSFKKHPCYHMLMKGGKRFSARAFRRFRGECSNGNFYRKVYNSYNVIDYIWLADIDCKREYEKYRLIGRWLRNHTGNPEIWEEFIELSSRRIYFNK